MIMCYLWCYVTQQSDAPQVQPPQPDIRGVGISFDQERDRNGLMRVYVRRIRPGSSAAEVCGLPLHMS